MSKVDTCPENREMESGRTKGGGGGGTLFEFVPFTCVYHMHIHVVLSIWAAARCDKKKILLVVESD